MLDIFLICLISVVVASDCQTIHPDLNQLIPKDLLPDNLFHSNPISLHYHYEFDYYLY
jgi:hypothetical protein